MAATANANSGRALALARRKAMSSGGKAAVGNRSGATAAPAEAPAPSSRPPVRAGAAASAGSSARKASLERRRAMSTRGKLAVSTADRIRGPETRPGAKRVAAAATPDTQARRGAVVAVVAKVIVATRRRSRPPVPQWLVHAAVDPRARRLPRTRARRPHWLAAVPSRRVARPASAVPACPRHRRRVPPIRNCRAVNWPGPCVSNAVVAVPAGRRSPHRPAVVARRRIASPVQQRMRRWKVGASETNQGQTVTGTMVGRSHDVTGDEPSTCRGITGTEYLGADIFREFCQSDPASAPRKGNRYHHLAR